jgi:hypothetical protein
MDLKAPLRRGLFVADNQYLLVEFSPVASGISETTICFTPYYSGLRKPQLRFTTEAQRSRRRVFFPWPGDDGQGKEPPPPEKAL